MSDFPSPQGAATYIDVSPLRASELINAGAVVIDVREPDEYDDGHIAEAELIPLGTFPARLNTLPQSGDVIIICRSGNRSVVACKLVENIAGRTLYNVVGGILAWERAGLPVSY